MHRDQLSNRIQGPNGGQGSRSVLKKLWCKLIEKNGYSLVPYIRGMHYDWYVVRLPTEMIYWDWGFFLCNDNFYYKQEMWFWGKEHHLLLRATKWHWFEIIRMEKKPWRINIRPFTVYREIFFPFYSCSFFLADSGQI